MAISLLDIIGTITGKVAFERSQANFTTLKTEVNSHGTQINDLVNVPACRVYHSLNQSLAVSTNISLAFDSERFDTDEIHDITTNNTRLTCKTAGLYLIFAGVIWDTNVTNQRNLFIRLNGIGDGIGDLACTNINAITNTRQSISTVYKLNVGDYVELVVNQNSGGSASVMAYPAASPEFGMVKVG